MEIGRREVLRLLSLSALAVGGGSLLAGCGGDEGSDAAPAVAAGHLELVSSEVAREPGDPGAVKGVVASLHTLGGGILGAVGDAQPGNLAISPYSIGVALALTLNGARGETLDQMTALFDDADVATINGGLDALTADIDALRTPEAVGNVDGGRVELASADQLFGQRGERWDQDFLDTLARSYGAGLRTVDYVGDAAGATAAINGWTATRTHGRITDIVSSDAIDALTRLVLVNALYLKAPWQDPFPESQSENRAFTRLDGSTVQVTMMRDDASDGGTASGDGWVAVSRPYLGGRLAMTIVLPDADRYDDVRADLVAGHLPDYLAALRSDLVDLTLPRWTFRTAAGLEPALRALGMTAAFDSSADFGAMTTQDRLVLSAVLHQVFVAVDELGTEAAAVTAVGAELLSRPVSSGTVVVDRPFFFAIHDVAHGTPLFLGTVVDPTG